MNIEELKRELKVYLSSDERRYRHSIGVMEMSEKLAIHYGCDAERCKKAALMHDLAKTMPNKKKLEYVEDNKLKVTKTEIMVPGILHGKIAADICKKKYGFDKEMCDAIENHTTGRANMSLMEKIIYVADAVEINRDYSDVKYYRDLAFEDLDRAVLEIVDFVIEDNIKKGNIILEKSIESRNFILINRKK